MDFEFSAEQEALRDSVRRLLHDRAPIRWVREQIDNPRGVTDDVWGALADLGVIGLLAPDSGAGYVDLGAVLEEMGRAVFPGPFASSAVGAMSVLRAVSDTETAHEIAAGTVIGTVAMYEPGRRYAWRSPNTVASSEGRLTGTKVFVADAMAADRFYVTALDRVAGFSVYEVDGHAPGVAVIPEATVDVTRRYGTVELRNAAARRIPVTIDDVARVVDALAVASVVDGVGAAEQALTIAVQYAKERVQFGKPIGSFQAVQHLCAVMLQSLELARAGAYYALWALDSAPPEEAHRAATMAKAYASDALPRIAADAIQVFGGIGFTWEHDAHLYFKRLLSLSSQLGGTTEHLEELATIIV